MGRRLLLLVRHGEPAHDPALTDESGSPDGPLTERGQQQAAAVAARLQHVGIDGIHTSTLRRARHTSEIIADRLGGRAVRATDVLREVVPNVPPPEQLSPAQQRFFATDTWPPGVLTASAARAYAQLDEFACAPERDLDTTDLLVTHGNVIAWFVVSALDAPPTAWVKLPTHDYAALTAILYRTGRPPTVLAYNDAGHLPPSVRGLELPDDWRT